jgi:uncharacterized membrane protein YhaH (DUF805 family)
MNWYLTVLRNYAVFSGRARRKEYWMFALFNLIFLIVAMIIDKILGTRYEMNGMTLPYGYVYTLYALAIMIPGLAVLVRRLHDVGHSGWFMLIGLIPLAGPIWLLVVLCTDSDRSVNNYGPNPKEGSHQVGTSGALDSDIKI